MRTIWGDKRMTEGVSSDVAYVLVHELTLSCYLVSSSTKETFEYLSSTFHFYREFVLVLL